MSELMEEKFLPSYNHRKFKYRKKRGIFMARIWMIILLLSSLGISRADVLNPSPSCNLYHPEMGYAATDNDWIMPHYSEFFLGVKGAVKRIIMKGDKGNIEFSFDKAGHLVRGRTLESTGNDVLYKYDSEGRIKSIDMLNVNYKKSTLAFKVKYSYYKEKNLVIEDWYKQPDNSWAASYATVRSGAGDSETCFQMSVNKEFDSAEGEKYFLSRDDKNKYIKIKRNSTRDLYSSAKNKREADSVLLVVLNDLQGASESNCFTGNALDRHYWDCSFYTALDEGKYRKFHSTFVNLQLNNAFEDWLETNWYINSLLVEEVSTSSDKLPSGKYQHSQYKYEFDSYKNWVKRVEFVTEPASISSDEQQITEKGTVTRSIEYY